MGSSLMKGASLHQISDISTAKITHPAIKSLLGIETMNEKKTGGTAKIARSEESPFLRGRSLESTPSSAKESDTTIGED